MFSAFVCCSSFNSSISPVSRHYFAIIYLFHNYFTVSQYLTSIAVSHQYLTIIHQYLQYSIISPLLFHQHLTIIISPVSHQYFTSISRPGAAQANGWTLLHTISHRPANSTIAQAVLRRIVPSFIT